MPLRVITREENDFLLLAHVFTVPGDDIVIVDRYD